jgi:hypothetical protein
MNSNANSRNRTDWSTWVWSPPQCRRSLMIAHIAYCVALLKIADFLTAGVNVSCATAVHLG